MACITLLAPMAMATTRLTQAIRYEDVPTIQIETRATFTPLRMSWVVATDDAGNRSLRMEWEPSA